MNTNKPTLTDTLLKVANAPHLLNTATPANPATRIEFNQSTGTVEVKTTADTAPLEGEALRFVQAEGLNTDEWEVTGFRRTEYGNPDNPMMSTRFTYRKKPVGGNWEPVNIDEIINWINQYPVSNPPTTRPTTRKDVAVIAIGDMQIGKYENLTDGNIEAAAERVTVALTEVADQLTTNPVKEILILWLGDHIEGFVSQGGANAWRTRLTLAEQLRITRRLMTYTIQLLRPLCDRLVVAAVPGNHGEAQRFNGKGVTTATDNHDTECLNAVAEAFNLNGDSDIEFLVPGDDELSLAVEVGGIIWGATHGHKWRPGKHAEWWEKQVFHNQPTAAAEVLFAGHWHHLLIQDVGRKLYIQVPAMETGSTWWQHQAGTQGHPGIVLVYGHGGEVERIEPIRA